MTQRPKLTRPIVSSGASFHPNQAWRDFLEKGYYSASPEPFLQNCAALGIATVCLKDILCQIESYRRNLHGGWLLYCGLHQTSNMAPRRRSREPSIPLDPDVLMA
jgi:hypothetical protein